MIMYIIRLANGFAYGVVSTATSTIIASCIPLSRKGEGINYYGLSTSVAAAVGPFYWHVHDDTNFFLQLSLNYV